VNPGLITLVVEGDLAACRASVDAGVAAASRIGEIVSQQVIGAPVADTGDFVLELAGRSALPFAALGGAGETPATAVEEPVAPAPAAAEPPSEEETPAPEALPPENAAASLADIVDFLSRATRGFTWRELGERFPHLPEAIRGELERAVRDGRLDKRGGHYRRIVPGDEPAPPVTRKRRGRKAQ
jgi:ethanolamine utilization protein EutK